jgi:hypothetical protein
LNDAEFHDQVQQRHACGGNVISMFENNPVCAAFGLCSLHEAGRAIVPIEWDVYVDKALCATWGGQDCEDELVDKVLHTMLIAHGGLGALLAEAVGLPFAYRMVRATDIAALGGFVFVEWMRIFHHALDLYEHEHSRQRTHGNATSHTATPPSKQQREASNPAANRAGMPAASPPNPLPTHTANPTDLTQGRLGSDIATSAVAAHRRLFTAPLRVFLDIKSSLPK